MSAIRIVLDPEINVFDQTAPRIYVLHYRWIHWIMLLISITYCLLGRVTNYGSPDDLLLKSKRVVNNRLEKSRKNALKSKEGNIIIIIIKTRGKIGSPQC